MNSIEQTKYLGEADNKHTNIYDGSKGDKGYEEEVQENRECGMCTCDRVYCAVSYGVARHGLNDKVRL